jgi:hypothetical protein
MTILYRVARRQRQSAQPQLLRHFVDIPTCRRREYQVFSYFAVSRNQGSAIDACVQAQHEHHRIFGVVVKSQATLRRRQPAFAIRFDHFGVIF